jgi:hypothetical protein
MSTNHTNHTNTLQRARPCRSHGLFVSFVWFVDKSNSASGAQD